MTRKFLFSVAVGTLLVGCGGDNDGTVIEPTPATPSVSPTPIPSPTVTPTPSVTPEPDVLVIDTLLGPVEGIADNSEPSLEGLWRFEMQNEDIDGESFKAVRYKSISRSDDGLTVLGCNDNAVPETYKYNGIDTYIKTWVEEGYIGIFRLQYSEDFLTGQGLFSSDPIGNLVGEAAMHKISNAAELPLNNIVLSINETETTLETPWVCTAVATRDESYEISIFGNSLDGALDVTMSFTSLPEPGSYQIGDTSLLNSVFFSIGGSEAIALAEGTVEITSLSESLAEINIVDAVGTNGETIAMTAKLYYVQAGLFEFIQ